MFHVSESCIYQTSFSSDIDAITNIFLLSDFINTFGRASQHGHVQLTRYVQTFALFTFLSGLQNETNTRELKGAMMG